MTTETTAPPAEQPGSTPLKDARVEQFAQLCAGAARRQRDCYLIAFPLSQKWKVQTQDSRASEMAARAEVRQRINWLRGQAARAAVYELVDHLESLRQIAEAATEAGDYNAAARAEEARGKAAGFLAGKGDAPPPPSTQPVVIQLVAPDVGRKA